MSGDGGSVCMFARVFVNQFMASRRPIILCLLLTMASVNMFLVYLSARPEAPSHKQSQDHMLKQNFARAPRSASVSAQRLSNELNSWIDLRTEDESVREMRRDEMRKSSSAEDEDWGDGQLLTGIGEVSLQRLEVKASETEVDIRLNDKRVYYENASSVQFRGLHALVLSQITGDVMTYRRFDTVLSDVYNDVILFLDAIHAGRIVVFASSDDFSYNLHADLRYRLAEMGSQFAPNINFRDQWAMITIKGSGESLGEAHSPSPAPDEHGGPLFLRVDLPVGALPVTEPCKWSESDEDKRRSHFCSRHEGYAGLCRCLQPHIITPRGTPMELGLDSVYTVVMATHRPQYLYTTLKSLATASGTLPYNVVVYLESTDDQELIELVELFHFQVRFIATVRFDGSDGLTSAISVRVMSIIEDTFLHFPDAEFLIFLEEDLQCSPDFYIYFSTLRPLLDQDKSIFSISAFNIHASTNTSHAPSEAYRVDSFSPVAFLLSKSTYIEEVRNLWPQYSERADWFLFLERVVKKQRECVVPDVNRVYHTGRDSLLINTNAFDMFYQNLSFNPDPHVKLNDVTRLHKSEYEVHLEETLKAATIIDDFRDICSVQNMTSQFKPSNRTEVIFFEMKHADDTTTWKSLAQCWGLWSENTDGNHKGLWRFWMENKKGFLFHVIFIGVPYSQYSKFKPGSLKPYKSQEAAAVEQHDNKSAQVKQKYPESAQEKQPHPESAQEKQKYPKSAQEKQIYPESAQEKQKYPKSAQEKQIYPESAANKNKLFEDRMSKLLEQNRTDPAEDR